MKARFVRAILLLKYERIEPLGRWFAERLREVIRADEKRLWGTRWYPYHFTGRERKNAVQPGGTVPEASGEVPGYLLPAGAVNADGPSSRETFAGLRGALESVRGAFALKEGGRVDNSRILLLDDVITTGATLDACPRAR
jgi:hypothetical protein